MRLRRVCFALALAAALWAVAIVVTEGVVVHLAGMRVSSRTPRNPALVSLVAAAVALFLARPTIGRTLADDARWAMRAVRPRGAATWLLVAGVALQVSYWRAARPLWLDEEMIALNIRDRSLVDLAGPLWLGQGAPLGWLVTERLVGLAFGFGEAALRAVPLAFGLATLMIAWWVGRRWMSAAGAAALVFLAAFGQWAFHYSIELKHYSADMYCGLLLPAMVVWALEGRDPRGRLRRAAVWWATAAVAQAWSMGGLLVAPACAAVLAFGLWRRDGRTSLARFAAFGAAWLVCFLVHYAVALRYTAGSDYLRTVWTIAMPPEGSSFGTRVVWLVGQAGGLAEKPGGTGLATLFWILALAGFAVARPPLLGLVLASVPLSAAVLAMLRLVPLFERLTIWALPAMYVGIALAFDAAVRCGRDAFARRAPGSSLGAGAVAVAVLVLCVDVGQRSWLDIPIGHPADSNHTLDDRSAVRWLVSELRPGDALLTTELAEPALWWYGDTLIGPPGRGASLHGVPILEVHYHQPNPECGHPLADILAPYSRALVYFGFRFDDVPDQFDDLLVRELEEIGDVEVIRAFAGATRAAVVHLSNPVTQTVPPGEVFLPSDALDGCLSFEPAVPW